MVVAPVVCVVAMCMRSITVAAATTRWPIRQWHPRRRRTDCCGAPSRAGSSRAPLPSRRTGVILPRVGSCPQAVCGRSVECEAVRLAVGVPWCGPLRWTVAVADRDQAVATAGANDNDHVSYRTVSSQCLWLRHSFSCACSSSCAISPSLWVRSLCCRLHGWPVAGAVGWPADVALPAQSSLAVRLVAVRVVGRVASVARVALRPSLCRRSSSLVGACSSGGRTSRPTPVATDERRFGRSDAVETSLKASGETPRVEPSTWRRQLKAAPPQTMRRKHRLLVHQTRRTQATSTHSPPRARGGTSERHDESVMR